MFARTRNKLIQVYRQTKYRKLVDIHRDGLIRLGSPYGGWWVPESMLRRGTTALCAGAGEDITFDVALLAAGMNVYTIDPTPRAIKHFEQVAQAVRSAGPYEVGGIDYAAYGLQSSTWERIRFIPKGLWTRSERLRFYAPKDPQHVSYSATNLQSTTDYFEADCLSVSDLKSQFEINDIGILKLDIEGAAYDVLTSLMNETVRPYCIAAEFDDGLYPDEFDERRFLNTIELLKDAGYVLAKIEQWNLTFTRRL